MLKKVFGLVSVLILMFASCGVRGYIPQNNIHQNYNNLYGGTRFWLTEEAAYYMYSPGFTAQYYEQTSYGKRRIMSSDSTDYAKLLECDNILYMLDHTSDFRYRFHTYDLQTREHKELVDLENSANFFVLDNCVYFIIQPTDTDLRVQLDVLSLDTLEKHTICQSIVTAGVVDGKPAYITQADALGTKHIFHLYDPISQRVEKTIELPYDIYSSPDYSFTSEYLVASMEGENGGSKVISYNLRTNEITEHTYNEYIRYIVAYERYAFISTSEKNIYRINLWDGSFEKITDNDEQMQIFVTSDEDVYVVSNGTGNVYHYNVDGSKECVFTI